MHTYCNVLKNGTDTSGIQDLERQSQLVEVDSNFKDCISYYSSNVTIKNIGNYQMKKYIRCFILNGHSTKCDWEWLEGEKKFRIFANRSAFVQRRFEEFEKFGIGHGDMFGVLRCHMKIQYLHGNVKFDLPFVSSHPLKERLVSNERRGEVVGIATCFGILSFLMILLVLWVYRKREKRFADKRRCSR